METRPHINVREAEEEDISAIRDIFKLVYSTDYPYQGFYDENWLKRSVFNDDILMLVAEDTGSGEILGTASVLFDTGAHSDLVGEFGRLVVAPNAQNLGIGKELMDRRIDFIQNRLHVGIVENRTVHPYSQRISKSHGFAPVGFLPFKLKFGKRENMALFVRHFGTSLSLRRNHPRLIPEAHNLAHCSLENCGLAYDAIIDEEAPPYPHCKDFALEELTDLGLPSLIRIERGRVHNREVFGPMGLQYGFFRLKARHATYLVARELPGKGTTGPIAGAIGYILDQREKTLRVFELISQTDQVIRFLFERLLDLCKNKWRVEYVEVDASAYSPRIQRTLLELGFLPAAYIPGMVFHNVERLDVVKMVHLLVPFELKEIHLIPPVRVIADQVIRAFTSQNVVPYIAKAVNQMTLFKGLNEEQAIRLAGMCSIARFKKEESLFHQDQPADKMFIVIKGEVIVTLNDPPCELGRITAGESVGEFSFLTHENHSASAHADSAVTAAEFSSRDLSDLVRQRPDIGLVLFQNLAIGLGRKLQRLDKDLVK